MKHSREQNLIVNIKYCIIKYTMIYKDIYCYICKIRALSEGRGKTYVRINRLTNQGKKN